MRDRENYILISGGLDSYTLLMYMMQNYKGSVLSFGEEYELVHFSYGAPYEQKELKVVKDLVSNIPFLRLRIISISDWVNYLTQDNYILPSRNLTFFSMLTGINPYADSCHIYIAGVQDENHKFMLDKNSEVFEKMSKLLTEVSGKAVVINAPFFDKKWSKLDAIQNVFFETSNLCYLFDTTSCYHPTSLKCGECFVCAKRWLLEAKLEELVRSKYPKLLVEFLDQKELHPFDKPINPNTNKHILKMTRNYLLAVLEEDFSHYSKERIASDLKILATYREF